MPNYSSIPCRAMQPAKQAPCLHFVPLWPQAPSCCCYTSRDATMMHLVQLMCPTGVVLQQW